MKEFWQTGERGQLAVSNPTQAFYNPLIRKVASWGFLSTLFPFSVLPPGDLGKPGMVELRVRKPAFICEGWHSGHSEIRKKVKIPGSKTKETSQVPNQLIILCAVCRKAKRHCLRKARFQSSHISGTTKIFGVFMVQLNLNLPFLLQVKKATLWKLPYEKRDSDMPLIPLSPAPEPLQNSWLVLHSHFGLRAWNHNKSIFGFLQRDLSYEHQDGGGCATRN